MKIDVINGSFGYKKTDNLILKNINFSVESGDILAILGPNGAGKTTLLKCLTGLLKWTQGNAQLDGKDLSTLKYKFFWQNVAYVPQAKNILSAYTVEEMILLGRSSYIENFRLPDSNDMEKTEEVIARLHLEKIKKSRCSEISGGELQMVLIARALCSEPKILILDEPESNLDFRNQLLVLDTMSELAADGMACIFNTHYPAHALRRANKALMLSSDGSYEYGKTSEVVTEESIEKCFGVHAVISDVETPGNIYQDVVPVSVRNDKSNSSNDSRAIACISIILPDRTQTEKINRIIHTALPWLIGRMGMPYPQDNVFIINLMLDAPKSEVKRLTDAINMIPSVSVKATYSKEFDFDEQH